MREFLLSLGIFLGIVQAQPDPSLTARLYRDTSGLSMNVELRDAVNNDANAFIKAGNRLVLRLSYERFEPAGTASFSRTIVYDLLNEVYRVEEPETNSVHETASAQAAVAIFSRFYALPVSVPSVSRFPLDIKLEATLQAPDQVGFDPAVLWNYKHPVCALHYSSLTDIPF